MIAMVESVRKFGVRETIVITLDGFVLSGHRRVAAAREADLKTVPVRHEPVRRVTDDPAEHDQFMQLLREYNRSRVKSFDEVVRESVISANPEEVYENLLEHRQSAAGIVLPKLQLREFKKRCTISKAKEPMLKAIAAILEELEDYLPVDLRRIHYLLAQKYRPLKHASKPDSHYGNDPLSYDNLVKLMVRARIEGDISIDSICDGTRPIHLWETHRHPGPFIQFSLDNLFKGYWRDLMQSQPNHIEIFCEKNTADPILRRVASRYTIPMSTGRGFTSLPPRRDIADRFEQSGKKTLVLLIVSDHDPDGEVIAESFARSLRDDFGIDDIHPVKVAVTYEQVKEYGLLDSPILKAKDKSPNYDSYVAKYGESIWEIEALPADELERVMEVAVESVIDRDALASEIEAERKDAMKLNAIRAVAVQALAGLNLEDGTDDSQE